MRLYGLTLDQPARNTQARYNVCPTDPVDTIVERDGKRELVSMRWGLVPRWWSKSLKDVKMATFNARAETVETKPFFRNAFKRIRCLIPVSGYYEWVRREVVCVIVRRCHPTGPAVPSAVPYEVGRFGNEPSKSPRTMNLAVLRRVPSPQGLGMSASIRRTEARVGGMVSESKPLQVSSSMKEPKMQSGSEARSGRMLHSHPSWAEQAAGIVRGTYSTLSHIRNTVSPYRSRKGSRAARCDDSGEGRGWRSKRRPRCNGADTSNDARRESGLTSSWSSNTRELGKSANRISR